MLMEPKNKKSSVSLLGPGFRFHPTDEELVRYYLRRKVCGKSFRFHPISEVDIYKVEPWDLPRMSNLKTRDLEWYFFSMLDKKYGNGARTNRATEKGYWKTTGKDRSVYHNSQIVGMKKTLVYHIGRAPKGQRTNWVMHEYRLADLELQKAAINQDAIVLCRVFQKSGSGPKNGEQYGAPFIEEEWEDDELQLVPKQEAAEEVDFGDDLYLDGDDLEQILESDVPSAVAPLLLNAYSADDANYGEETSESISVGQQPVVDVGEHENEPEKLDEQNRYDLSASYDAVVKPVRHEYMVESSEPMNFEDVDYLLDEPFMDASDNVQYGDGEVIDTNDLSDPGAAHTSTFDALEEYLTFFDANNYDSLSMSNMMGGEDLVSNQEFLDQKNEDVGAQQATLSTEHVVDNRNNNATSSSKQELAKCQSDFQYPFMEQASRMLGSLSAPPAFASEFPSKSATLLHSASSSAHVTAGMIQIRNLTVNGNGTDQSLSKNQNFNIVISFGLSRGIDGSANLESRVRILPGKTVSATSGGWFDLIFFLVLVLSMSFKIGTYIYAR